MTIVMKPRIWLLLVLVSLSWVEQGLAQTWDGDPNVQEPAFQLSEIFYQPRSAPDLPVPATQQVFPAVHSQSLQGSPQAEAVQTVGDVPKSKQGKADVVQASAISELDNSSAGKLADEIPKRIEAVQAQTDLTDEIKASILQAYQRANESLKHYQESRKKTADLKTEREQGPETIKKLRAELSVPLNPEFEFQRPARLAEVEQLKLTEDEIHSSVLKELDTFELRAKTRAERKPQMPALIEKTKQQIDDAKKALENSGVEGEPPAATLARKTEQQSFLMLLEQQLEQYRIEQSRYEALSELFPLQRDLLIRKRNHHEKRLEQLKGEIAEARRIESERQAAEARRALQNAHPALRELAERNAELIEKRKVAHQSLEKSNQMFSEIDGVFVDISKRFQNVAEKESIGALSTGVGLLLRNQRTRLPSQANFEKKQHFVEQEISRLQLEVMPLQDERDELGDIDHQLEAVLAEVGVVQSMPLVEFQAMTRELLVDRRKYLDDLIEDYSKVMTSYGEVDAKAQLLIAKIDAYENFIDERILWVRSAEPISLATVPKTFAATRHILDQSNLKNAGNVLFRDVRANPGLYLFALSICLAVVGLSHRIQRTITNLATGSKRQMTSNVASTLMALALTIISASAIPMFFWLLGSRLVSVTTGEFCIGLGHAIQTTAYAFWSVEVFRQICRRKGIAETFLEWPSKSMAAVRKQLLVMLVFGLPLMFVTAFADAYNEGYWADSIGRFSFVLFCICLVVMVSRMLHPKGKILGNFFSQNQSGLLYRTRIVWYSLFVLAPAILGVMSLCGYQYTAEQLLLRLQFTFWLSMSMVIAYSIVMQWMLVARKQMAMEQARARRNAAIAAAQQEGESGPSGVLPAVEVPHVDLSELNQQVIKFVQVAACVVLICGGWMIWSQVMPALQVVNRVHLWPTTVQVSESVDVGDGQEQIHTVEKQKWITLGNLIVACGMLVVAVAGSKNLPGFLEFSILQRLPIEHGERNAITTLCCYVCMMSGAMFACRTLGIGWSSVQWLVAALTVGLGFGLQEIFANFVSGLIILFERPIRIGDVVTIDSVTGTVTKIRIRATTITDWDRKEYIVPNKEFVTGRLLNWTLSDKTNRVVINVGVAYGSDTDEAIRLLLKAANEHPAILTDPAPMATFEGFGDSCLCLILRAYLPSLDNRLSVISELHRNIDLAFRQADIEIAFPQMDLHVRNMPELVRKPAKVKQDTRAA